MRNKGAVVLLSGGLDSAVCLYLAKRKGYKCNCLIFDYGQRHKKEVGLAKKISVLSGSPYKVIKLDFPWKGSALLDRNIKLPVTSYQLPVTIPSTYVPARNIIFLSFAVSYAEAIAAKEIFIGAHCQDYSGYPDCRPEFFRAFNRVIACGTKAGVEKKGIRVNAPLLDKTKAEIIRLGKALGVPFALTWSCYRGRSSPCGECDSCRFRAKGFIEAGLTDPLEG